MFLKKYQDRYVDIKTGQKIWETNFSKKLYPNQFCANLQISFAFCLFLPFNFEGRCGQNGANCLKSIFSVIEPERMSYFINKKVSADNLHVSAYYNMNFYVITGKVSKKRSFIEIFFHIF
jgi:hypothetical protein